MTKSTFAKILFLCAALSGAGILSFGPEWITAEGLHSATSAAACDCADCPSRTTAPNPVAAQRALAVFIVCISLWLTHVIPLAITGLLAFGLLSLLGVTTEPEVLKHLGNKAVFFMLGVFFLVAAMIGTGLSKRLTLMMIQRLDSSPRKLFTGVLLTASALSLCMPEHAVAAMLFPVVLEVVEALKLPKGRSRYARILFMAMAWGACIGGVGTFLGGARAPLAISLLYDYHGTQISFLQWAIAAIPLVVLLTVVASIILPLVVGIDIEDVSAATTMINERVAHLGPISRAELRLAVLGVATIACWVLWGHDLGLASISAASACLLFVLRIVSFKDIQNFINWNVLLMYGGAIAIGAALNETGAASWLVHRIDWANMDPIAIVILLALSAVVLTESVSNTATVVVLLPVGYSIAAQAGLDPVFVTLVVTIPAGLPFCLPVSSPPHAIAFSAGYYDPRDCLKAGLPMVFISLVVFVGVMLLYWPLVGINMVATMP